jgi:hypothetical protein
MSNKKLQGNPAIFYFMVVIVLVGEVGKFGLRV